MTQFTLQSIKQLSKTGAFDAHYPKITEAINAEASHGGTQITYKFGRVVEHPQDLMTLLKNTGLTVKPIKKYLVSGGIIGLKIEWKK